MSNRSKNTLSIKMSCFFHDFNRLFNLVRGNISGAIGFVVVNLVSKNRFRSVIVNSFCYVIITGWLISPYTLYASEKYASNSIEIIPEIKIEDESSELGLYSFMTTYLLLSDIDSVEFTRKEKKEEYINFLFVSGKNYINNRRVNRSAVDMLAEDTINIITNLDTHTDVCFIQKFSFEDGTRLTLGVHNEDNIGVEDVYKCFTVTLWYFVQNTYKDVDMDNWHRSLAELISLAQKGENHGR